MSDSEAYIFHGVELGDTPPDWLRKHCTTDEWEWEWYETGKYPSLVGTGIEFHRHGYNGEEDQTTYCLGFRLAWASDFGHSEVDLGELRATADSLEPTLQKLLLSWSVPEEDVEIKTYLAASYG